MFKDGDLVKPTKKAFLNFPNNDFGSCVGVVCTDGSWDLMYKYRVEWSGSNETYWYNEEHLEYVDFTLENE